MERGPAREAAAAGQQADPEWSRSTPRPGRKKSRVKGAAGARSGVPALLHAARRRSVRRGRVGDPLGASSATRRARSSSSSATSRFRKFWSQQATNIVVSKYFRGQIGTPERERSVKQLIGRVVDTITRLGARRSSTSRARTRCSRSAHELKHLLVYQKVAFNSPVWFNCGFEKAPQCSACFINSVEDTMDSILTLAKTEGMLFKFGSGTGSNLSAIRSSKELLAGGGTASRSGLVHEGLRRVCRRHQVGRQDAPRGEDGHPQRRPSRHRRVHQLQGRGREEGLGAHRRRLRRLVHRARPTASVFFQNSNNSVRVTDDFMRAVLDDGEWQTQAVTTRRGDGHLQGARPDAADRRGHAGSAAIPGMQFDTTVNEWHTCPNTARINASNPCSEYMFLDDSACNLASINLMKFVKDDGEFDVGGVQGRVPHAHHGAGDHRRQRELSDEGDREEQPRLPAARPRLREPRRAADVARPAVRQRRGPRLRGGDHRGDDRRGLRAVGADRARPRRAVRRLREEPRAVPARDAQAPRRGRGDQREATCRPISTRGAKQAWDEAVELGEDFGYRNAQATVLAPTGTIGFMMDCDTTGVEPDIALVKYKKLVGGGLMKIVNSTVPMALEQARLHRSPRSRRSSTTSTSTRRSRARRSSRTSTCRCSTARSRPAQRRAVDPLHGAHQDDGRRAAVHLGRDQQDGQRAARGDGRGDREGLHRVVAAGRQGDLDLPRRQQAHAAAQHVEGAASPTRATWAATVSAKSSRRSSRSSSGRSGASCPTSGSAITHKFDIAGHEGYITVGLFEDGHAGRDLPGDGEGRLDDLGLCRRLRAGDLLRAAVRRAAAGAGRQVQPRALRAVGDDEEPRGPLREVDRRLHLPVDGDEVPLARGAVSAPGVNMREEPARDAERRVERRGRLRAPARPMRRPQPRRQPSRRPAEFARDAESGRRAAVQHVRLDHDPQRQLLQVRELRDHERVCMMKMLIIWGE